MKTLDIFRDKQLTRSLIAISVPIAMQNLITYCTSMMDTVMLGQLGEVQLSGATVANQFTNIFMGLTFGIASGTNVLLAQYWGKKDVRSIRSILAVMYWTTLALAAVFFCSARFFPQEIMRIFTPDQEVIAQGAQYLEIVCWSYWGMGLSNVMLMSLRSVGTVRISLVVYLSSLFINTGCNWLLIFGNLGFPRLEMRGAAIATVLARLVELSIAAFYIFRLEKKISLRPRDVVAFDRTFIRDFAINVSPVILNEFLWSMGNSALMMIMGRMGRAFVTASSITNITSQFAQIFIIGLSNATSVIIGNTVGTGDYDRAKSMAKGITIFSVLLGVGAGLIIFLLRPVIVSFYNIPDSTKEVVLSVMTSASVIVFFQCMAFIELMGILRGGGDVRFVLVCDIIFLWLCSVPLGTVAGLYLGLPPAIVYLVLKCDEMLKLIAGTYRIFSGKWVKNLTRQEI